MYTGSLLLLLLLLLLLAVLILDDDDDVEARDDDGVLLLLLLLLILVALRLVSDWAESKLVLYLESGVCLLLLLFCWPVLGWGKRTVGGGDDMLLFSEI